jgi:hypothetical protein
VVAADTDGLLGEPLKERGAVGNLARCFGEGLAHLGGHDGGQPVGIGSDQIEGAPQDVCALARGRFAPRGLCATGCLDGRDGVFGPAVGHFGNDFMCRWVFHAESGCACGLAPDTVDEQVSVKSGGVNETAHLKLSVIRRASWSPTKPAAMSK